MASALDNLLLHPQTFRQTEQYLAQPSHALLVIGGMGSGKKILARYMAADVLELNNLKALLKHPYYLVLKRPQDKQNIPIEAVRELIPKLHLRTSGRNDFRRAVLIEDAHDLSEEAQNALLKILEEPALDTFFIMTTVSGQSVLPTIASRAQKIYIQPINLAQAKDHFGNQYPAAEIERSWALSQGNASLLISLLANNKDHPLKEAIAQAKTLIRQKPFERLQSLNEIGQDKKKLALTLEALNRVLSELHHSAIEKDQLKHSKQLLLSRRVIKQAQDALQANVSPRLIILRLSLELKF